MALTKVGPTACLLRRGVGKSGQVTEQSWHDDAEVGLFIKELCTWAH